MKERLFLGVFFQRKYKSLNRSLLPCGILACKLIMSKDNQDLKQKHIERGFTCNSRCLFSKNIVVNAPVLAIYCILEGH
jgi:hypothetical protein